MGRLKSLKPRIASLAPRLGHAIGDERGRDRQRSAEQPWRKWYKTARWRRLAQEVYARDLYTCQRTGQLLTGKAPAPNSPVANHKTPHRGDPTLFWDINNIETVAQSAHDGQIQSEVRQADRRR